MPADSKGNALGRSYRTDVPKGIKSKVEKLKEHEARIFRLQKTIIDIETKQRALKNELRPYQISPDRVTNVIQLPSDILILIFENALDGCHPDINRLLLVSRRWYNLILDTQYSGRASNSFHEG